MNVQRFEGRDMAEVLRRIRRELGPDAVIMSTQTRQGGGLGKRLRRRQTVEVIAGLPEPDAPAASSAVPSTAPPAVPSGAPYAVPGAAAVAAARRAPMPVPSVIPSLAERFLQDTGVGGAGSIVSGGGVAGGGVAGGGQDGPTPAGSRSSDRLEISGAARLAAQQAQQAQQAPPGVPMMPASASASAPAVASPNPGSAGAGVSRTVAQELHSLRTEIAQLRRLVETPARAPVVLGSVAPGTSGGTSVLSGLPAAAQELLERLRAGGVSERFVERAAGMARATLGPETSAAAGRAAVLRALLSQLPGGTAVQLPADSQSGVFVVGPCGAGKTLAAVKLARALQQSGREVVLVNADQQRPGAGAQLSAYGEALRIPTMQIYAPSDLGVLAVTRPEAVFVVDTAGGVPTGSEAMALRALVHELPTRQVLLTLSATSGAAEMARAQAAFAALAPDGLIMSQADAALGFGATVSFLSESATPLFYLSQHADVLRPLEVANPATLLERVLQQGREGVRDEALAS